MMYAIMIYLFTGANLINWIMCNKEIMTTGKVSVRKISGQLLITKED